MKQIVLCALLTLSLHTIANAQTPDAQPSVGPAAPHFLGRPSDFRPHSKDSATKRAVRQLKTLENRLRLNEDQVLQLQVILINRDVAMDSVQNNPSGNRRTDNRARRAIQQDADQKVNALLTDDQKTLYQQWKQEQKEKMQLRRQMHQGSDSARQGR